MNLPNLVTLLRILLTPLMVILLIDGKVFEAFGIFVLAGFTDALDGLLARALKQKTRIGAILDPIADKLLLNSSYVALSIMGLVPSWLAVLVISRDVIIVFGVLLLFLIQGGIDIKPTFLGKITTFTQLSTVFFTFWNYQFDFIAPFMPFFFVGTGLTTVASGFHYMALGIQHLGEAEGGTG